MNGVVWFREDLRIRDNKALHFAMQECSAIAAVYIIDHAFFKKHDIAGCRVEFILRGLTALSQELSTLNVPLLFFEIDQTSETAPTLAKVIAKINASALYFNRQYEIDEKRRDFAVQQWLESTKINCYSYDDQVILPPRSIQTRQGGYFKVFTPYRKAWYQVFSAAMPMRLLTPPKPQPILPLKACKIPAQIRGYQSKVDPELWPAGEKAARQRLQTFIKNHLSAYAKQRDFPALPGTSKLSPYLTAGMISPRECFLAAYKANHQQLETGDKGATVWMAELIWREFYKHFLEAVPRISMHKAYQLKTEKLPWNDDENLFSAWSQGQTGFPIIDAAMRQLNTTGWMHNRLRMIVASFLAKNLQLDWRLGEKYFMQHLIDGDLAANNGGWQWSASTGVDAVPYFRVFNPQRQSQRFDPQGDFIRQFCPELKQLSAKEIHNPTQRRTLNYPSAIVDLAKSRRDFIAYYKKI